ncbi:hypothetical protein AGMMS49938_10290 [Fibrobacterales bacterium]|nr:hypothetical protein AGMMS49938_10290 [Fibrobacterales bacterium]
MKISFSPEISPAEQTCILQSNLWNTWLKKASAEFVISEVHFASVDFRKRDNNKEIKNPLFIKLKATATDKEGKPQHGVCVLRGDAVGVLVVLECENEKYLLLVEQPRFPLGERRFLEIPAGILDWSNDPLKIAIAELKEEAQIDAAADELKLLTPEPIAASCGLLDEKIYLYAITRTVSNEELAKMNNRAQEYTAEEEWIETKIIPFSSARNQITDSKSLSALYLYLSMTTQQSKT